MRFERVPSRKVGSLLIIPVSTSMMLVGRRLHALEAHATLAAHIF